MKTLSNIYKIVNIIAALGWAILIFFPFWDLADTVIIKGIVVGLSLFYVYLLFIQKDIKNEDYPKGNFVSLEGVMLLFKNPRNLLAGWVHYLAFDLILGIYIKSQANEIGMSHLWQIPCFILTFIYNNWVNCKKKPVRNMRIGLVTKGSRGDIQPFIALAIGLKNNGHQVTIVTFKNFENLVTDYNIEFCPLSMDIEKEAYTEDVLEVLRKGNMMKFAKLIGKNSEKYNEKIIFEIDKASDSFDFIIASGLAFPNILPITLKKNIKYGILNFSMPYSITKEFPAIGFGFQNIPFINKISYSIFTYIAVKLFIQKDVNLTAKLLNLPNWKTSELMTELLRKNRLIIHPMSNQLLKQPKDWPSNSFVTGFLEIPTTERNRNINEQIPEALKAWIEDGEKPIYIGFGSIPIPDTNLLKTIIDELLTQTNHRIVFCNGWTKPFIDTKHKNLFVIENINHEWLFPKCKMAIIHGGIGTIGSSLKSGIPMVIVSIVADQPFNGKLIEKNKTGVHIPFKKLTFEKLLGGITKVDSNEFKQNTKSIEEKMHLENGVNESLIIIENYVKQN